MLSELVSLHKMGVADPRLHELAVDGPGFLQGLIAG